MSALAALALVAACSDSEPGDGGADAGEAGASGATPSMAGTSHVGASGASAGVGGATSSTAGVSPGGEGGVAGSSSGGAAGEAPAGQAGQGGNPPEPNDAGAGGGGAGAGGESGATWPPLQPPYWDGSMPTSGVCSVHHFCWNAPFQSSNNVYGVWASSPTNVWVAGSAGMLARYNGATWSGVTGIEDVDGATFASFRLIRGTQGSTSNVWAVGWDLVSPDDQFFYRFDGVKWTKMTSPILPVRDIWATGTNELWTANAGGFVSHWNGSQWSHINVNKDVTGIYGFSNTDVWVSGETVLQFNGTTWSDKGGGGPSIWGATSGNMWTGNGAQLVGGVWQPPKAGQGTGFKKVIGASATDLFFLGQGSSPTNYYLKGALFHYSDFAGQDMFDVWPLSATDYWVVGERDLAGKTIFHGDPTGLPQTFTAQGPSVAPEPEPQYKTIGKALLEKVNGSYMPLKAFDAVFVGKKHLVWDDSAVWALNDGLLWQYTGGAWTTLPVAAGCEGTVLQIDEYDDLWLMNPAGAVSSVCKYDGSAWTPLDLHLADGTALPFFMISDLTVRGHEAWLVSQLVAFRFNGSKWDRYILGVDPEIAHEGLGITSDGQVYTGDPLNPQLVFRP